MNKLSDEYLDQLQNVAEPVIAVMAREILELREKMNIAVEALEDIFTMCDDLYPNSGHMYLSTTNTCRKSSKEALARLKESK